MDSSKLVTYIKGQLILLGVIDKDRDISWVVVIILPH